MVFPSFALWITETSQETMKRSDPKEVKKTRVASDYSTARTSNVSARTSNVFEVQGRECSEAVLPFDDVNVTGNVLEVRDDSETALTLNDVNVTDDILKDARDQVHKGFDVFVESEQNGVKINEELSKLDTRMETSTENKVHFRIPAHLNKMKTNGKKKAWNPRGWDAARRTPMSKVGDGWPEVK